MSYGNPGNPNPTPPPIHGRWQPGQSGNPKGRPIKRPIGDGLKRLFAKLSDLDVEEYNRQLFMKAASGDVQAWEKVADRVDGKVAQPIGGTDDLPDLKIQAITRTIIEPALELEAESEGNLVGKAEPKTISVDVSTS